LQSALQVLHLEFQTQPDGTMLFRMLDYWVRRHRRLPDREIRQVVIYFLLSRSPLVDATTLRQATQQIEQIRDRRTQSNLSASATILAGLVLECSS
jgi:predicted transposase YdaD